MALPDRPLRVTMVNKYYSPPHLGGVEMVVRTLSEGLVRLAGAQVRAVVCNEGRLSRGAPGLPKRLPVPQRHRPAEAAAGRVPALLGTLS